jgi:cyclopropane-fatty-acyl-phospholipid synthase
MPFTHRASGDQPMTSATTRPDPAIPPPVQDLPPTIDGGSAIEATVGRPGKQEPSARRLALARAIVLLIQPAIVDRAALEVVVDVDRGGGHAVRRRDAEARGTNRSRATVTIRGPDALGRSLWPLSPDAFAEGYLRGDLEIEGDVMAAVEAGQALDLRRLGAGGLRRLIRWGIELRRGTPAATSLGRMARISGRLHSPARDMEAVRFHYDVGNAFYALWLDRRLTYSCAYFPDGTTATSAADRLDEAQEAKLDLIARKLRLGPDLRLLDIGSGWGSLIAFAGERYGCRAVGVTLSERQAKRTEAAIRAAGLDDRVGAHVIDYRDLTRLGTFDRIASVGMFEHVGRAHLPTYFRSAYDALRPGGLFLNHGIAQAGAARGRSPTGRSVGPDLGKRSSHFIDRYVFPDGELVPVETAIALARAAGFEVLDVQSLRPHYALTLAAWIARLESHWEAAVEAAGIEVARTWRLYMSAARLGFERGDVDVFQLLLAKPEDTRPAEVPLRPWW